jgi:hypothetical protein
MLLAVEAMIGFDSSGAIHMRYAILPMSRRHASLNQSPFMETIVHIHGFLQTQPNQRNTVKVIDPKKSPGQASDSHLSPPCVRYLQHHRVFRPHQIYLLNKLARS